MRSTARYRKTMVSVLSEFSARFMHRQRRPRCNLMHDLRSTNPSDPHLGRPGKADDRFQFQYVLPFKE